MPTSRTLILLGPLAFFQIYLAGTLLLFAFGPWRWAVDQPLALFGFLVAVQVAILAGYLLALRGERDLDTAGQTPEAGLRWFKASLAVNVLLALPTAYARTGAYVPDALAGIVDPGAVYMANVTRIAAGGDFVYVEYARILFAAFTLSLYPLTMLYWKSLTRTLRIVSGLLILFNLLIFISVGQNKGLADIVATLFFLVVAGHLAHRAHAMRAIVAAAATVTVGLVAFFFYFGMTQLLRRGGAVLGQRGSFGWETSVPGTYEVPGETTTAQTVPAVTAPEPQPAPAPTAEAPMPTLQPAPQPEAPVSKSAPAPLEPPAALAGAPAGPESAPIALPPETVELPAPAAPPMPSATDIGAVTAYPDHWVARVAPDFVRSTYESFARYLGQGYQALSLTLDLDHSTTWGFGNSMFFARNADRVLGTEHFVAESLPGVLERETGWSMFHLWHSIYPWIASDVGFVGTILVMGVLGFLLAKAWARTMATLDPLWGTLLFLLLIAFFYVPANNQLMQSGETAFGFVTILGLLALRAIATAAQRRFGAPSPR